MAAVALLAVPQMGRKLADSWPLFHVATVVPVQIDAQVTVCQQVGMDGVAIGRQIGAGHADPHGFRPGAGQDVAGVLLVVVILVTVPGEPEVGVALLFLMIIGIGDGNVGEIDIPVVGIVFSNIDLGGIQVELTQRLSGVAVVHVPGEIFGFLRSQPQGIAVVAPLQIQLNRNVPIQIAVYIISIVLRAVVAAVHRHLAVIGFRGIADIAVGVLAGPGEPIIRLLLHAVRVDIGRRHVIQLDFPQSTVSRTLAGQLAGFQLAGVQVQLAQGFRGGAVPYGEGHVLRLGAEALRVRIVLPLQVIDAVHIFPQNGERGCRRARVPLQIACLVIFLLIDIVVRAGPGEPIIGYGPAGIAVLVEIGDFLGNHRPGAVAIVGDGIAVLRHLEVEDYGGPVAVPDRRHKVLHRRAEAVGVIIVVPLERHHIADLLGLHRHGRICRGAGKVQPIRGAGPDIVIIGVLPLWLVKGKPVVIKRQLLPYVGRIHVGRAVEFHRPGIVSVVGDRIGGIAQIQLILGGIIVSTPEVRHKAVRVGQRAKAGRVAPVVPGNLQRQRTVLDMGGDGRRGGRRKAHVAVIGLAVSRAVILILCIEDQPIVFRLDALAGIVIVVGGYVGEMQQPGVVSIFGDRHADFVHIDFPRDHSRGAEPQLRLHGIDRRAHARRVVVVVPVQGQVDGDLARPGCISQVPALTGHVIGHGAVAGGFQAGPIIIRLFPGEPQVAIAAWHLGFGKQDRPGVVAVVGHNGRVGGNFLGAIDRAAAGGGPQIEGDILRRGSLAQEVIVVVPGQLHAEVLAATIQVDLAFGKGVALHEAVVAAAGHIAEIPIRVVARPGERQVAVGGGGQDLPLLPGEPPGVFVQHLDFRLTQRGQAASAGAVAAAQVQGGPEIIDRGPMAGQVIKVLPMENDGEVLAAAMHQMLLVEGRVKEHIAALGTGLHLIVIVADILVLRPGEPDVFVVGAQILADSGHGHRPGIVPVIRYGPVVRQRDLRAAGAARAVAQPERGLEIGCAGALAAHVAAIVPLDLEGDGVQVGVHRAGVRYDRATRRIVRSVV